MGTRRERRRSSSLPRFKAGSRPPPNNVCTYNLDYVRQDVYACKKCNPACAGLSKNGTPSSDVAELIAGVSGFCGGCKLGCHGDHLDQVIDLYSKRGFRCDCGNGRMSNTCKLQPNKAPGNPRNTSVYNHNFWGDYCCCNRGYNPVFGDMLQCAICEDWFHEVCFKMPNGKPKDPNLNLESVAFELICAECAEKVPLLEDYFSSMGLFKPEEEAVPVSNPAIQIRPVGCKRPPTVTKGVLKGRDLFWPQGFRARLCRCTQCQELYKQHNVAYLVDRKDFVSLVDMDDDDMLIDAPSDAVLAANLIEDNKRHRRAGNARSDPEESDSDDGQYSVAARRSRSRSTRRQRAMARSTKELPAAYRQHMRTRIAVYLSSSLNDPKQHPTEDDIKHMLATLRNELVSGNIGAMET